MYLVTIFERGGGSRIVWLRAIFAGFSRRTRTRTARTSAAAAADAAAAVATASIVGL